jgi:hypothetical protein
MKKTNTIQGTYGSGKTPCRVFTLSHRSCQQWYAVEGSRNVNLSPVTLEDGQDVEEIPDIDAFTWPDGVNSEEELAAAVEA